MIQLGKVPGTLLRQRLGKPRCQISIRYNSGCVAFQAYVAWFTVHGLLEPQNLADGAEGDNTEEHRNFFVLTIFSGFPCGSVAKISEWHCLCFFWSEIS
jgi:hypothetical protein